LSQLTNATQNGILTIIYQQAVDKKHWQCPEGFGMFVVATCRCKFHSVWSCLDERVWRQCFYRY